MDAKSTGGVCFNMIQGVCGSVHINHMYLYECNSQGFEVLHLTEGIGLDGTNRILSQVPVGTQ